jgi:hypothetical protein
LAFSLAFTLGGSQGGARPVFAKATPDKPPSPTVALDLVDQACAAVRFRTLTQQTSKSPSGEPASLKLRRPGTPPERAGARALGFQADRLAADRYFTERREVLANLAALGIPTLDTTAQHLAVALASRYLDIKASGRL